MIGPENATTAGWDIVGPPLKPSKVSTTLYGCPMFAPALPGFPATQYSPRSGMRLSPKESRMYLPNPTKLDRKSGIRGWEKMGGALRQLSSHYRALRPPLLSLLSTFFFREGQRDNQK